MSTVTTTEAVKEKSIVEELPDYADLWEIKKYKEDDLWFMKVGECSVRLIVSLNKLLRITK